MRKYKENFDNKILGYVKENLNIYILRYFLTKINKICAVIVVPISKKSYDLQ
ncbi:hypothetical protein KNCP2_00520 [Candidatus Rickettsia kedanie]|uniref:Uncharacterized protein n=1 Tax=Candidatus Rickettsia kedanie TaxID=3115352 RepID=A0ABP9TVT0_9RICK